MNTRIWLITGASAGFGRSIAEAALAAGDSVVAAVRRPAALDDLAARYPQRLRAVEYDVTRGQAAELVADVLLWHGRIDVLVNNAGRGHIGAVEETSERELRELMELHFYGPVALTRAVLPHLRSQGSGAIVQLSSMGGRLSFPGVSAYSASKFALEGLSEALAAEVAPFGIRVLIVEPGAFRTSFNVPGAAMVSPPMPEYEPFIGPFRAHFAGDDGRQPGDPDRAAAAILAALDAEQPPLRLALGDDAADLVRDSLDRERAEFERWEHVTRDMSFAADEAATA